MIMQVGTLIIGGGPTGLGAATRLNQHGRNDWLLIDRVRFALCADTGLSLKSSSPTVDDQRCCGLRVLWHMPTWSHACALCVDRCRKFAICKDNARHRTRFIAIHSGCITWSEGCDIDLSLQGCLRPPAAATVHGCRARLLLRSQGVIHWINPPSALVRSGTAPVLLPSPRATDIAGWARVGWMEHSSRDLARRQGRAGRRGGGAGVHGRHPGGLPVRHGWPRHLLALPVLR